ncbi:MAG: T9SS type A sorting domain-containing protein [Bacteroidota bacterium]
MRVRTFICTLFLTVIVSLARGQAPFNGGSGDGYDMAEVMGTTLSTTTPTQSVWKVYPTTLQAGELLHVEGGTKNGLASLIDPSGKVVWETETSSGPTTLSLPEVATGNYILLIKEDNQSFTQKIQVR